MTDELFHPSNGLGGYKELIAQIVPAEILRRTEDPITSHVAAFNASKRGPSQRIRIFNALMVLGNATDYELGISVGILRSSAAKRRQELQQMGLVKDSGIQRPTDTGINAIVWVPTK